MASEILIGAGDAEVRIMGVHDRRARGAHETAPSVSKVYIYSHVTLRD